MTLFRRRRLLAIAVPIVAGLMIATSTVGDAATATNTTLSLAIGQSITIRCPGGLLNAALDASPFKATCGSTGPTPPTTTPPTTSPAPPTTPPTTAPPATTCTNPAFSTTGPAGYTWPGGLITYNSQWNDPNAPAVGPGSQAMYACSAQNMYVVADMPPTGQPTTDVKSFPAIQEDFSAVPVSIFSAITSTFGETDPHVGDYEDAYDIWLNAEGTAGANEVMVWTNNHGQTPAGSAAGTVVFGGVSYTAYHTSSNGYIAFVAQTNVTSGSVDLLSMFHWLITQGWVPASSTVYQISFGVEICSTNYAPATFGFTNFSINAQYPAGLHEARPLGI